MRRSRAAKSFITSGRCLSPLTPRAATAATAATATGYLSFSEDRDSCSRSSQSVNAEGEAMSWVSEDCLDYTNMSLQTGYKRS